MSSPPVLHPEDERLLSLVDGELSPEQTATVQSHLASCAECRDRTEQLRLTLADYDAHHRELKGQAPPPPTPWPDIQKRMHELDAGRVLIRRKPPLRVNLRWAAAAAGILAAAFLYKTAGERTVSAAELLQQASARVQPAPSRRIQIKTRRTRFTRPAQSAPGPEHAELAAMFREANFSWEDPLNPRSFAAWRDTLVDKDDQVKILNGSEFGSGRFYRITTASSVGNLAEASITIRAADLRAVHESLHFRNSEVVEIAEAPSEPVPPTRLPPPRLAEEKPEAPRSVTASDELRVVAALHAIGADLGEPVEVQREKESIIVSALAAGTERQNQIRTALAGLSFVELRFEDAQPVRSPSTSLRTESSSGGTSPLQARLAAQLGGRATFENFTNAVLDASEAALARAFALRALATRFGPAVEAEFQPGDREQLHAIRQEHTNKLGASLRQLVSLLQPVAGSLPPAQPHDIATWQDAASGLAASAQELDRLLNRGLAGTDPNSLEIWLERVRGAAGNLQSASTALDSTVARSAPK